MKKYLYTSLSFNILGVLLVTIAIFKIGSIKHIMYLINHRGEGIGLTIEARRNLVAEMKIDTNSIVMLGNSLTANFDWTQRSRNINVANLGIPGETTQGVISNLNRIIAAKPKKIFIEIGINDICKQEPTNEILAHYDSIVQIIRTGSPSTALYVQSLLPINNSYRNTNGNIDAIEFINKELRKIASEKKATYLDLFPLFVDKNRELKSALTYDGIHLSVSGYEIWYSYIANYIKE